MSSKLKNILAFAKLGIPILPLAPGGDAPAVAGGAKAGVTEPKTLRKLYTNHPDYNYGLVTEGGIFFVSANGKSAKARLNTLASESGGCLPKTVTFRMRGVRYYAFRAGGIQVRSSQGELGKSIDVFGADAYVPGPGSKLSSGIKWRFAKRRALDEVEIAESPEWLSNMIGVASAPASSEAYPPGTQLVVSLPISAIFVDPKHVLDPEDVDLLDGSIGVLGLHTPITVMPRKNSANPETSATFEVVAGHSRLAAMRKLGCDRIDAFISAGDEIDARLWGIAENLDRRVLSVVEVAEKSAAFDRLLRLKLEQVVQDAPPGGQQPHDQGIRKAAKRLGISREKMRRRRIIAGLSAEARAEAKVLGLHDNQSALLEAAEEETPNQQISKLRALTARRPRSRKSAEPGPALDNNSERERANKEAEHAEQRRSNGDAINIAQLRMDLQQADEEIPAFLDRRPLSAEDQRAFDDVLAAWEFHLQPLLTSVSAVVRARFRAYVLQAAAVD